MTQPVVGDAFGELLREEFRLISMRDDGRPSSYLTEIVERDDGFVFGARAGRYFDGPEHWLDLDHRAVGRCSGRVLDIGAGAGRIALELHRRGLDVTALDVSPGAVEVVRARGVPAVVRSTVDDHSGRYDTLLLLGANLGLCGSRRRAPAFFTALAALAAPGARIVAHGTGSSAGRDPELKAYEAANLARGELGGLTRMRVRHRRAATDWFDYLYCSPDELAGLLTGTGWAIEEIDDRDRPSYLAILRREEGQGAP